MISQDALGIEQARVEATVIALPGQQMFAGDKLGELAPDRIRLLQQSLPVCDVRPGNLFPQFGHLPIWNLGVKRPFGSWHVVALFNWGARSARRSTSSSPAGSSGPRRGMASTRSASRCRCRRAACA